ncbi:universal stress protein [Geodermatophilus aquaeductus]|uniref:Nucleotide-binding universal stress protein, UspA family n=1 Tax=Geodermatophilus aquaeductus TaxID=1564161 RepID=A0A521FTE0_9ACTN|nr:universal stress protein [Geodermatophilus aquaeductus]SMO99438.1 Nucleotide-binding universal stress protein, UspA family [Geodermatophilus aquaeductus]
MTSERAGERIVVGVDGSPGGRAALVWALAAGARAGAEVEVVSAVPVNPWSPLDVIDTSRAEHVRADTEARLRASVAEATSDPAVRAVARDGTHPVVVTVVSGSPAEALVARAEGAGLLVVGSRGRGAVRSALLGSVALHCAAHAPCPVVVVHPGAESGTRVVVGVDDSPVAHAALTEAVRHARRLGAAVEAVLVCQPVTYWSDATVPAPPVGETLEAARGRAERIVAAVLGPGPHPDVEATVETGAPGDVLVRRAAGAALLVVGSRSRSRLTGLALGSVALHCVVHASCPVLVVRHGRAHAAAPGPRATSPARG